MNAYEIAGYEVYWHQVVLVLGFFREAVRQPRHSPIAHPVIQVLMLNEDVLADVLRLRLPFVPVLARGCADGRGYVGAAAFRGCTVVPNKFGIVDIATERAPDRVGGRRWLEMQLESGKQSREDFMVCTDAASRRPTHHSYVRALTFLYTLEKEPKHVRHQSVSHCSDSGDECGLLGGQQYSPGQKLFL